MGLAWTIRPHPGWLLVVSLVAATSAAQEAGGHCPLPAPVESLPGDLPAEVRSGEMLRAQADEVDLSRDSLTHLRGHVDIVQGDQWLRADQVSIDRVEETAQALGAVRYVDPDLSFSALRADVDMAADIARLSDVEYRLGEGSGRGGAARVEHFGDNISRLDAVTFTTCPAGNRDWYLAADKMTLRHDSGRGSARDVTLRFKNVPLLRLPWMSFPLDERRQSGFLLPGIGGSDDGIDLQIPYYLNIAPNQDATLTPRLIGDRGAMLIGEYRYLGRRYAGQLNFEHLPHDDLTGDHRSYSRFQHYARPAANWLLNVDLNHVSDDRYFEDLGDSLAFASRSFLRSYVQLYAVGDGWRGNLLVDAFDALDESIAPLSEPYWRVPRLTFSVDRPVRQTLRFELDSELVGFQRDEGIEGARLDLYPRLSLPLFRPGYFLYPSLGVRHTQYDLDREVDASPTRTTPIASLDGGLFFERRGTRWRQTLEPRLFYLYVPFEEQNDLPRFDSGEFTFSFGQLFRPNRFSGADRQGDANQLSMALTTRLLDERSGREMLTASIGTIVYFRDQRVQLSAATPAAEETSPLVAEITYRPADHWRINFGFQIDPREDTLEQAQLGISYRTGGGRLVNFGYRRRSDVVDQLDASFVAPLGERWTLLGRINYSFEDDTILEGLAGFEYASCCWALRTFARRYVRNREGAKRNGLYLELELTGLGSLGRRTGPLLERAILGFRSEDYFKHQ